MYEVHRTRNGDEMLICQMDDGHLINTIRLYCRTIAQATEVIESNGSVQGKTQLAVINPDFSEERTKDRAKRALGYAHRQLPPYIVEATLRQLDVSEYLQHAYGRSEAMETSQFHKFLNPEEEELEAEDEVPIYPPEIVH